jgi:hypothetical protein
MESESREWLQHINVCIPFVNGQCFSNCENCINETRFLNPKENKKERKVKKNLKKNKHFVSRFP